MIVNKVDIQPQGVTINCVTCTMDSQGTNAHFRSLFLKRCGLRPRFVKEERGRAVWYLNFHLLFLVGLRHTKQMRTRRNTRAQIHEDR